MPDDANPKRPFVNALLCRLEEELATIKRAAKDARDAATHEEAKPENDKDTRALEASYLAGAQAARARELEGAIKATAGMALLDLRGKNIQASALVVLEDEGAARTTFFFAPFGGGIALQVPPGTPGASPPAGASAQVVTPQSPLGQALLGRSEGETIELRAKGALREMTIVDVW